MGLTSMEKGKQVLQAESSSSSSTTSSPSSSSVPLLLQLPPLPLPTGIKFSPTETELIGYYLHKKAAGKQILPAGFPYYQKNSILDCEVYGNEEPSQIFKSLLGKSKEDDHDDLYVFTPFKTNNLSLGGKSLDTRAGNGIWKPRNTVICRDDGTGCAIGRKTTLSFFDNKAQRTPWVMHQYTLLAQHSETSWALCHIRCENNNQSQRKKTAFPDGAGGAMPSSAKRQKLGNCSYGSLSIRST